MPVKIIIPVGHMTVEVTGAEEKEAIERAAFFSELPQECPVCQATLMFGYRRPQGKFDYYSVYCTGKPSHEAVFGIHNNEARSLFYKRDQWGDRKIGQARDDGQTSTAAARSNGDAVYDDDIPWDNAPAAPPSRERISEIGRSKGMSGAEIDAFALKVGGAAVGGLTDAGVAKVADAISRVAARR